MNLLIDLGNTRLKWALSGQDRGLSGAVAHRDVDVATLLDGLWSEVATPHRIVMASVASDATRRAVESWVQLHWNVIPHVLHASREQLGVVNTYKEPSALGADRWAALLGAREVTKRACAVVSCGTAVTVDALSSNGEFAGGVILPGLHLMRHSLGAGTAGVGFADGEASSCLAHVTADGVSAGTLFGLAGAIERCLQEQERELGEKLDVLLAGGDASSLAPRLNRNVTLEPDIVLKGLVRVAESL